MLDNQIVAKINTFPEFGRAASLGMIIAEIEKETKIVGDKVRRGLTATFTITRRHGGETLAFFVSRLVGEKRWYVDAVWTMGEGGRLGTPRRNRPFGDRDDVLPLAAIFGEALNEATPRTRWDVAPAKVAAGIRFEFSDNTNELEEMTGELDKADEFTDFEEMDAEAAEAYYAEHGEEPKPAPEARKPLPPVFLEPQPLF
ncbi:hypothetical protein [Streptomyces sp. NPDC097610]|uniref:hypothetical protein n=1 Tax=Streptomyces sp. NPDC097610 TaxID=3157227 RepID=UPI003316CC8C